MLKFVERRSSADMLQFIVNLLYLGMKSDDYIWAEANGTEQAVTDLLSMVSDSFIKVANNILLNGAITISSDRHLKKCERSYINVEEYQDIVDILRGSYATYDFSERCKSYFKRLTKRFSVREDLCAIE